MVAYLKRNAVDEDTGASSSASLSRSRTSGRHALTRDMLHGLSTEEFDREAKSLADAEALTPEVRARLRTKLVERLKTPIDPPTWGPDWVKRGKNSEPLTQKKRRGFFASLFPFGRKDEDDDDDVEENEAIEALDKEDKDDARVIAHNMEKSRQVWHFRSLYILAAIAAIGIALFAMAVDFSIIKGDIWTRALANEFMVVPPALQGTLLFKSLQVVFAVLIVHFMLKITGVYGRNAMVATGFVLVLVMIGGLGYLVAYNNMTGGTSTVAEHMQGSQPQQNSIDQLFASDHREGVIADNASQPRLVTAGMMTTAKADELPLSLPKPSDKFLANADVWLWFAFASFIFFIVTIVAALYMQTFENNVRNFLISRDYLCRRQQFAQLHLLELADRNES